MKILKMNWAKTSWLRQAGCGNDALVSFDCFVPKEVFEIIKPTFEGYIQKNEKKAALYNLGVISALLENNLQVELDGVNISKEDYKNRKASILGLCEKSTNETIANLAKLYNEEIKHKAFKEEVSKTVNEIFGNKYFMELSKGVEIPSDSKFETINVGGVEYIIDFKYGVQKSVEWEEVSHESFHPKDVYRAIPNKNKLSELKVFLEESKAYSKNFQLDQNGLWLPGFDAATYEPRKKPGNRP